MKMERLQLSRIPPSVPCVAPVHAACRDVELVVFMWIPGWERDKRFAPPA